MSVVPTLRVRRFVAFRDSTLAALEHLGKFFIYNVIQVSNGWWWWRRRWRRRRRWWWWWWWWALLLRTRFAGGAVDIHPTSQSPPPPPPTTITTTNTTRLNRHHDQITSTGRKAMGSYAQVEANIAAEMDYQSCLELNPTTHAKVRALPRASEVIVHARQQLVARLDGYSLRESSKFEEAVNELERVRRACS